MSVHWGGRGLGHVSRKTTAAAAFDPAITPFAAASDGWYYDFTDPASMTQVSDGSGGVPAAGDPIGRISDKSPLGHNSTSLTTARPTYQTSGVAGAEFDGSNDFLTAGDVCDPRTNSLWVVIAVKFNSSADGAVFAKSIAATGAGRYGVYRSSGLSAIYAQDAGGGPATVPAAADTSTAVRILTLRLDRTAGTLKLHINRVQFSTTASFTPNTGTDQAPTYRLLHGAYNDSSDSGILIPLNGRIIASEGVIAPTIDETMITQVEAAFAAKAGVTLP